MDAQRMRILLLPLVEHYADHGIDAQLTDDGMRLSLPGGTVVLETTPRLELPDVSQ